MQNGIFVDAFWNQATDEVTQDFVTRFTEESGKAPNIINATAYDAIQIGSQVFEVNKPLELLLRTLYRQIFSKMVTGATTFGDEQTLQRDMRIITIKRDRLEQWQPITEEGKDPEK